METFTPSFTELEGKMANINKLKKAILAADEVILATDDDREGEGIAWHICDCFNLPVSTTKRIIFHEITKTAILDALKQPGVINRNLVMAQQSRQMLDLIVGYRLSPLLAEYLGTSGAFAASDPIGFVCWYIGLAKLD